jgi:hypothetical protein
VLDVLGGAGWRPLRKIHCGILTYDWTGLQHMWSRYRNAGRSAHVGLAIAALGMVLRFVLSAASTGTNDIITWEDFAHQANQHGVLWMYGNLPAWNHPPLTGYLAAGLLRLSVLTDLRFPVAFKLAPIAADALCLVLLWKIWRPRSAHTAAPLAAVAIFSFSPDAILVSAFHGNNDPLVGLFVLAACYFIEEKASFAWAGVALAAAVNIKLIPLVLVPVFLANVRRWRDAVRFVGGLSLGAIPFIPIILQVGPAFYRNAIAYNSNFDHWGIPLFIRFLEKSPAWSGVGEQLHALYVPAGRYLIVAIILALCAWSRWRRPLSTYQLAAGGLAALLFFAPGFGVQYTAILGPVLIAASLGWGLWYAVSAGAFLASVYYLFWTREALLGSLHTTFFPGPSPWIGLVAWFGLGGFVISLVKVQGSRFRVPGSGFRIGKTERQIEDSPEP